MAGPSRPSIPSLLASLRAPTVRGLVALVAAAAIWGALAARLADASFGGDVRGLLHLAAARPHPAAMAGIPRAPDHGYDGQYYGALATDPWLERSETLDALDNPPYRAVRIGLPAAAWLVTFGRPAAAVVAYQLLCWLGAAVAVFLLARWGSLCWALAVALGAGTLSSVLRCTPDAAAAALILAALLAHRGGRSSALPLLAGAVLVRETSWLAALGIAVAEVAQGRLRRAVASLVLPALPLALWLAWLTHHLGAWPNAGTDNFALPLAWVARKAGQLGEALWPNPVEVVGVLAIVAILLSPLALLRRPWGDSAAATYLLFSALAWCLGWAVWSDAHAFSRVLLPLAVLAPLLASDEGDPGRRALLLAVPTTLLAVGVTITWTLLGGGPRRPEPIRPTARIAPASQPVFVLGAAHTRGRNGLWCTDLELANPWPTTVTVRIEVLPTDPARRPARPAQLCLRPREVRAIPDVLGSVVRFYGVVALRLTTDRPGVAIRWTTHLGSQPQRNAAWNRALPLDAAFSPGKPARLLGLAHDPAAGSRTDLALLNVCDQRIELHIELSSARGSRTARHEFVEPWQFVQLHDILAGTEPGAGAEATVRTTTPGGAFLVRATVLRPDAGPAQVEAEPIPH